MPAEKRDCRSKVSSMQHIGKFDIQIPTRRFASRSTQRHSAVRCSMRNSSVQTLSSQLSGKVTDPERENQDQVWRRSTRDILSLIPLAEKLNVRILIKNLGNGFCAEPKLMAQYIDAFESPWVGVHFDIGNHIFARLPPSEWIRTLGMHIRKLDIKDRTKAKETTKIGEGDADWDEVRKALVEIGYRGWAAAEVTGGDRDRLVEILGRMNRVVGRSDGRPADRLPGATKEGKKLTRRTRFK